ncbi:MAG: glutathione S-transferase family protein [Proteobacteria bacterium]|nr:glutathione S-transferase family protein [Pseudomonadota bacterium]
MHTLISLCFSHYVEKARWALDHAQQPYVEHSYMPVFSTAAVAWASRGRGGAGDKVSSRFSSPYLITEDGTHIPESAAITCWADARSGGSLYPTEEVAELERRFHDRVGPHARRIVYFYAFQDVEVLGKMAERNVSPMQARAFRALYPGVSRFIASQLKVDEAGVERSKAVLEVEAAAVAERLSDGRPFLCGDQFTAADLTFSALFAPAVLISQEQGYGAHLPSLDEVPPGAQELMKRWRDSVAGRHVIRMYRDHRRTPVEG